MKTKGGLDTLYSWKSSLETHDEVFLKKLQNEGGLFTPLFLADAKIKLLTPLIDLLLKKYDHELNVFKVKGKSLSITLEDILYLTHLPIDGKPVLCKESPSEVAFEEIFGDKKAKKIQDLKSIAFDKENDERQRKVAVLKMIIGCFIMPGYNGYEVSSTYVEFLKDLDEVPKYAWGAALLAFLVHGLRGCGRLQEDKPQKEGINGNFWIVLAFFFVRIPKLWGIMGITMSQKMRSQPLLSWVLKNLQNKCNDNKGSYVKAMEAFLDEDDVTNENIIWRPYLCCELPSALQSQSDSQRFLRLGPIFNNNYVVHHRPDRVKAQFGILDDNSTWIKEFEYEIKYKDNRGQFKRNYEAIYEKELRLYKKNIMFGSGPSSGSKTNDVEEEDDEIAFTDDVAGPSGPNTNDVEEEDDDDETIYHENTFTDDVAEFEDKEACEQAYFKMDNALIDDRRIHVDFSQSVSKLWNQFRSKGKHGGTAGKGCFKCGSLDHIAKDCTGSPDAKRAPKYTLKDDGFTRKGGNDSSRYDMVFDEETGSSPQRKKQPRHHEADDRYEQKKGSHRAIDERKQNDYKRKDVGDERRKEYNRRDDDRYHRSGERKDYKRDERDYRSSRNDDRYRSRDDDRRRDSRGDRKRYNDDEDDRKKEGRRDESYSRKIHEDDVGHNKKSRGEDRDGVKNSKMRYDDREHKSRR